MQLKIKKFLKDGIHHISLDSIGFTPRENKWTRKFGMPLLDLSTEGLGVHRLDQIHMTIRTETAKEAEEVDLILRQKIKGELERLLAQRELTLRERMGRIYIKRKGLVLGLTCLLILLFLSAFKGVICSQQISHLGKQLLTTVTNQVSISSDRQKETLAEQDKKRDNPGKNYRGNLGEGGAINTYSREQPVSIGSSSPGYAKPDFTIIAYPETLTRYNEYNPAAKPSQDDDNPEQFKLSFMTSGGFEGPVDLELIGSCYLAESHLFPTRIKTLPGSATLIVSLSPQCPHQVCNTLTIIARGITANGDLITHQKKLVLAVREKPSYTGKAWHVAPYGDDLLGEGDEKSPYRTVQKGIDQAQSGDTVVVERGLYREKIELKDKAGITLVSRYINDRDESTIKSTILEAPAAGWVVTIGRSDGVTLQGFTIRNGKGNDESQGGGIYCYDSNPEVLDNIITQNENHSGYGAGIYCYDSDPKILHNQITQNHNPDGHSAGIYCYNSSPEIEGNTISGNSSGGGGSAIHLLEPKQARIIGNLICNNSGVSVILLYHHGPEMEYRIANNTVSQNQGDAIRYFGGSWDFENNIVTENRGYGIFTLEGTAQLVYNDVWGNVYDKDTINYFGLAEDVIINHGNISQDPCFGNPPHGNFHLSYNSPCIDLGNPASPGGASRIDMGALEYHHPEIACGDVNRDGYIDFGDINFLCKFIYQRGSAPYSLETGDVDCDGRIDQRDLAYLYRYLYLYGSDPGEGCRDRILANSKK
jgi:hypothetical protein